MIQSEDLLKVLIKNKVNFFTGVPDSVLSKFTEVLKQNHIVAVNEGSAVAIAIGNYIKSKKISCVYMQNSGLGNSINPLISLASKGIYSIPMVLLIGWRGMPGLTDEPQHKLQGKVTQKFLKLLNIKYIYIKKNNELNKIDNLIKFSKKNKEPVAILISNKTLSNKCNTKINYNLNNIDRDSFIKKILENVKKNDRIISSTGYTSRALYQKRKQIKANKAKDFYMVGAMGHTAGVSLGTALTNRYKTICLDGDGSFLMHLGSLVTLSENIKKNFLYFLLDNETHESVGNQSTSSKKIDFKKFSASFKFQKFIEISSNKNLDKNLKRIFQSQKLTFVHVKTRLSANNKLIRPKNLKIDF